MTHKQTLTILDACRFVYVNDALYAMELKRYVKGQEDGDTVLVCRHLVQHTQLDFSKKEFRQSKVRITKTTGEVVVKMAQFELRFQVLKPFIFPNTQTING